MTPAQRKVLVARPRPRLRLSLSLATLATLGTLVGGALVGCASGQVSLPTPTCGTVAVDHLGHVNGAQAEQAETCFYQGFQQCQAVSLGLSHMSGVDTATESIFSVQAANGTSGGTCRIVEADYDLVNTSVTATTSATCSDLSRQAGGLLITSCSSGHGVSIPAPPPPTPTPTYPAPLPTATT
jgi:hypothetical protein